MSLSVYKWGWFGTAKSRAFWGWFGNSTFTGRIYMTSAALNQSKLTGVTITWP